MADLGNLNFGIHLKIIQSKNTKLSKKARQHARNRQRESRIEG